MHQRSHLFAGILLITEVVSACTQPTKDSCLVNEQKLDTSICKEIETGDTSGVPSTGTPVTTEDLPTSTGTVISTSGPDDTTSTGTETTGTSTGEDKPKICDSMDELNCCGNGKEDPGEECDVLTPQDSNRCDTCDEKCEIRKVMCCGNSVAEDWDPDPEVKSEECDDDNDDNDDGCTEDCRVPACGDGFVQDSLDEECDDGDVDSKDECALCKVAECGDGFVHAGVEECDDGEHNDINKKCSDGSSGFAECKIIRRVFLTSKKTAGDFGSGNAGDLGGIVAADSRCQTLADNSNNDKLKGRTFKAWLSVSKLCDKDSKSCPAHRFLAAEKPAEGLYLLSDSGNTLVAEGWSDLVSGLAHPIDYTDEDKTVTDMTTNVWTGTNDQGFPVSVNPVDDCAHWKDKNTTATVGKMTVPPSWTDKGDPVSCEGENFEGSLYCFEDF